MHKIMAMSLAAATATSLAGYALAGPDRVAFPDGYAETFVLYNTVDRPDRNTVRYMPDGAPKPDASFDGCFSCHQNRAGRDFNFTYSKYLTDRDGL